MTTSTRLGLRDELRIENYLLKFSWPMQDYPRKEYKQIKAELRASLRTAAADVGTQQAIADLGSPFALADQYIGGLGRKLPRWSTGAIAAGLAVSTMVYLALAYVLGSTNTLESLGGGEVEVWLFGAPVQVHFSDDAIWVQGTATWTAFGIYAGVALVAFALGSRFWRVFTS